MSRQKDAHTNKRKWRRLRRGIQFSVSLFCDWAVTDAHLFHLNFFFPLFAVAADRLNHLLLIDDHQNCIGENVDRSQENFNSTIRNRKEKCIRSYMIWNDNCIPSTNLICFVWPLTISHSFFDFNVFKWQNQHIFVNWKSAEILFFIFRM